MTIFGYLAAMSDNFFGTLKEKFENLLIECEKKFQATITINGELDQEQDGRRDGPNGDIYSRTTLPFGSIWFVVNELLLSEIPFVILSIKIDLNITTREDNFDNQRTLVLKLLVDTSIVSFAWTVGKTTAAKDYNICNDELAEMTTPTDIKTDDNILLERLQVLFSTP